MGPFSEYRQQKRAERIASVLLNCKNEGIGKGVVITLETLVNGGYVKTRTVDGELDLIKLTFEERLDDNATESKNS